MPAHPPGEPGASRPFCVIYSAENGRKAWGPEGTVMLLSFRFANHRSFRDEQQLNLTPAYRSDEHEQAVRVVGIFGANASGKSNCLDALAFMRRMAVQSDRAVEPGMGLAREPFRLAVDSLDGPSRYVVDLLVAGVRHTYGFTIDDHQVLDEWHYHYPLGRRRRISSAKVTRSSGARSRASSRNWNRSQGSRRQPRCFSAPSPGSGAVARDPIRVTPNRCTTHTDGST